MENHLLIVEDETDLCSLLVERFSREGYGCVAANRGHEALSLFHHHLFPVVISDFSMPEMNGLELLKIVKTARPQTRFILMTGYAEMDIAVGALRMGAYDFLVKPFDLEFMVLTVKKALEEKKLEEKIEAHHRRLAQMVQEQTSRLQMAKCSLQEANLDSVKALVEAIDAKDPYTRGHANRVKEKSVRIAKKLGLSKKRLENLEFGAFLHDIGKIGVRDEVLQKKGRLNPEEFKCIQEHPLIGVKIVEGIKFFQDILPAIRYHHEHFDGNGYPDGLAGEEVPLEARIISVADSFDAMTSLRSYRPAMPLNDALAELEKGKGKQYEPRILEVFLREKIYYP